MSLGDAVRLAAERILDPVEEMHWAIAKPWFAALGALGTPLRSISESMIRATYGSIRLGAAAVGAGVDGWVPRDSAVIESSRAIVSGLWGDDPELGDATMSLRDRHGDSIRPGPDLTHAFPEPTGRLVVLIHGLVTTERCWHGNGTTPGLFAALEADPRFTPLAVRYNSGLPVAANGERLAALLDRLQAAWPLPLDSVALVGHSMGGLVARSACAAGLAAGHDWVESVTDVVTIGSPHRGAPLEKLATAAAWGLGVAPQTRPLARFLDGRSQGIKDLRSGAVGSAGELGRPDVRHHFLAGVVTSDPLHPVGAVVGDLMVRPASGTRAPALEPANVAVLGGVHHFDLLNEPAVIDHVIDWLAEPE